MMQVRVRENPDEFGSCGCGRSPTGKCIGWHGLDDEAYEQALDEYNEKQFDNVDNEFDNGDEE
jgi:hypothetical protein